MRKPFISIAIVFMSLVSACQTQATKPSTSVSVVAPSSYVDYDKAFYKTPVTAYINTPEEAARIEAAGVLIWSACLLKTDRAPESSIDVARHNLTIMVYPDQNRFGFFNPQAVAAGAFKFRRPRLDQNVPTPQDDLARCRNDSGVKDLEPVSIHIISSMDTLPFDIYFRAIDKTRADPRFKEAQEQRNACTRAKGYPTFETGQSFDPGQLKDQAQHDKAAIAEAQCSDQSGFINTAVTIQAQYENELIAGHEAELIATRNDALARLATAEKILAQYGLA